MIKFIVKNQTLLNVSEFIPSENSINYLIASFEFKTPDWKNTIKTAVFKNAVTNQSYDVILKDDKCIIPWEVLQNESCDISVYGIDNDTRITTNIQNFTLTKTLIEGSGTQPPTPSVYEQLLKLIQSGISNVDGGTFEDWKEEI